MKDLEKTVVGSVLQNWQDHVNVFGLLKPEHFEDTNLSIVFRAMFNLNSKNKPIDIVTVCSEVKLMGNLDTIGGAYFISKLADFNVFSNLETHCLFILENYLRRQMNILGMKLQNQATDKGNDVFEVIGQAESGISDLMKGLVVSKIDTLGEISETVISEMREVLKTGKRSGVLSSIKNLNLQTSGWQKGNLIILAGRPGMGKTSAALEFALTPALDGKSVAFFSLEMNKSELTGRALSMTSYINVQGIINKTLNIDEINALERESVAFNKVPLFIDDTSALTVYELKNKARKLKRENGLELIVIDYLQLMSVKKGSKSGNREQEISEISRELKGLAKELEIPIIALSQLSRNCELRQDKKPMLSDLRESGAIEQDADMVIFTFRPEYYGITEYNFGNEVIPGQGLFIFIIAKFRNGQVGEVRAKFLGQNTMVANYNSYDEKKEQAQPLESNTNFLEDKF